MKKCSNAECTSVTPEFYDKGAWCKACVRKRQLIYRHSEAGKASHIRNRSTEKGLESKRVRQRRYNAKGNADKDRARWLKYNTITRDTLREMIHEPCSNCNENLDGQGSQTCSIANGSEDIKLCPVWQAFDQWGEHPLIDFK